MTTPPNPNLSDPSSSASPPAPRKRMSLTGEEIVDEAPSAAPAQTPENPAYQTGTPLPIAARQVPPQHTAYNLDPRERLKASYDTTVKVTGEEQKIFRWIWLAVSLIAVAAVALVFYYVDKDKKFKYQSHLHISTPKEAALEVLNSLHDDAISRFYLVTNFSDNEDHSVKKAKDFSNQVKLNGTFSSLISRIKTFEDIKIGEPVGSGEQREVPFTAKASGATVKGVVHLSNGSDSAWRFDCNGISSKRTDVTSDSQFTAKLQSLMGE